MISPSGSRSQPPVGQRIMLFASAVLFLMAWGVVLSGCALLDGTKPMVKIGLVAPFEGLQRALGYDVLYAVKLAIRERNARGGVGGYMVELVALNDDDDPLEAAQRAREMVVDPDVMGVIGHFSNATTLAAMDEYHRAGLALISPAASAEAITEAGYNEIFRLYTGDDLLGMEAARYAVTELKARRLALLRGRDGLAEAFLRGVRGLGRKVVVDVESTEADWLIALAEAEPDLIFFSGGIIEGVELLKRIRGAGLQLTFMGGSELGNPLWVRMGGETVEGTFCLFPAPPWEELSEDQAFSVGFQTLANRPPGPHAALAYDAANVLLDALEHVGATQGRPTRQAIVAAIAETSHQGLTGPIAFDAAGNLLDPKVYLYEVLGGRYIGHRLP